MIGELATVSVGGMLRLLSVYRQTGRLQVTGRRCQGEIYLERGCIVGTGAKKKDLSGEVLRLLLPHQGSFQFDPQDAIPRRRRQGSLDEVESLILEASRHCDPKAIREYLPSDKVVLQLAPVFNQRTRIRLDLERDEWNFLTKVNGEDNLQFLLENSGLRRGRAVQAAYGLLSAGLLRKIRFRIPEVMTIATRELGNMGEALVRQALRKLRLDQTRMHMKDLIALLNELERNITLLLGPSRAGTIIGLMWEEAKR